MQYIFVVIVTFNCKVFCMTQSLDNKPKQHNASKWLEHILKAIAGTQVTVLGDYCLDAYWKIESKESELSLETGMPVRRVIAQRYSPGGAGNVAMNLKALGVAEVRCIGQLGEDFFGTELIHQLKVARICTNGLLRTGDRWQTPVYAKPYRDGLELNRFDFGAANVMSASQVASLLLALEKTVAGSTAVVINQQLAVSFLSPEMIAGINTLIAQYPQVPFLIDSRHHAGAFKGAVLKLNAHEAARFIGKNHPLNRVISRNEAREDALAISAQTKRPVFVTRGNRGLIVANESFAHEIPGIQIIGKTDTVGAGDTALAALAAMLGCCDDMESAARLANLAASVTVSKLHTTGTVTPDELRETYPNVDYIYEPELAESPRLAHFLPDSEIEIIREKPVMTIRHGIFDHDGTLSTLRQGWEKIMEPMMLHAILGERLRAVSAEIFHRIEADVRAFIDKTTGIQTLAQMKSLIGLVREYGYIPEEQILDEHGYKAIYNQALLDMVRLRIGKIERGELQPADFEIKGARCFLEKLHANGVKLYLVSGTDVADVQAEAAVMGYAHLFNGGIHGAVGDLKVEAKRMVIESIIEGDGLAGPELLVVGDGPVELREGGRRNAFRLGIASNELCRYGLDLTKRSRLIRAGADLVIPDFSQMDRLFSFLGLSGHHSNNSIHINR
ncbi:MAG TPA: PfkB family carbohydrate kinase [Verrucomicrobiae bacterium]|jgi:rfaE bifunctional protein kinase chain/domain